MDGEVQLDLKTYRTMIRAILGRKRWLLRGFGFLVVAYSVLALALGVSPIWCVLYFLIGAAAIAHTELITCVGWRQLRGLVDRPWHYKVADDGIGIHTPATDVQFKWELITRATREPRAWALRTTTRQRLAIPRAAFSHDDAARIDQRFAEI